MVSAVTLASGAATAEGGSRGSDPVGRAVDELDQDAVVPGARRHGRQDEGLVAAPGSTSRTKWPFQ